MPTSRRDRTLGRFLKQDHERLEVRLEAVMRAIDDDDQQAALAAWRPLEAGLLAHFATEEKHLFPELEKTDPVEVAHLRSDHGTIRRQLTELGMCLELHTARKRTFDRFAAILERHAAREDALLYRWAESHVPSHVGAAVRKRLSTVLSRARAILHEHPFRP